MAIRTLEDKELQAHYDALFSMFGSAGWKAFTEQAKAHADGISDIRNVGAKSLDFRLGQVDVYDWVFAYERMNHDAYSMMIADMDAADEDIEDEEFNDDPRV